MKMEKKILNDIDEYFNKKFVLTQSRDGKLPNWKLPLISKIFQSSTWSHSKLLELKYEMNEIKNKLSDKDIMNWSCHTASLNITKFVVPHLRVTVKAELCTQAWCKFYEVLCCYPIVSYSKCVKQFNSVHLCEAPGAFISALNHYFGLNFPHVKLNWLASSLNPYFEGNHPQATIQDDRFIRCTLPHWYFGMNNTGDVFIKENREELILKANALGEIHLVTADGSVDCQNDPAEQESIVASLHLVETLTALKILSKTGSFVIKMFTFYEHTSVCLLYLLACIFDQVHVFKPGTSSAGNSEVYVIAIGYAGFHACADVLSAVEEYTDNNNCSNSLFSLEDIPTTFIDKVIECAMYFKKLQSNTILENLQLYDEKNSRLFKARTKLKSAAAKNFISRYGIGMIAEEVSVVGFKKLNSLPMKHKHFHTGSYVERHKIKELNFLDKLKYFEDQCIQNSLNKEPCQDCNIYMLPEIECNQIDFTFGREFSQCVNSAFCDGASLMLYNQLYEFYTDLCNVYQMPELPRYCYAYLPDKISSLIDTNNLLRIEAFSMSYQPLVVKLEKCLLSSLITNSNIARQQKMVVAALNDDDKLVTIYNATSSQKILSNFCTILRSLGKDDHLLLLLHPLFTRLEVGLVYILTSAFEKVNLITTSDGLTKGFAHCQRFKDSAWTLIETFLHFPKSHQSHCLLEIICITNLLDGIFFQSIYEFNDDFLLKQISQLVTFLKLATNSAKKIGQ